MSEKERFIYLTPIHFYSKIFVITLTIFFFFSLLFLSLKYNSVDNAFFNRIKYDFNLLKEKLDQLSIDNLKHITGYVASVGIVNSIEGKGDKIENVSSVLKNGTEGMQNTTEADNKVGKEEQKQESMEEKKVYFFRIELVILIFSLLFFILILILFLLWRKKRKFKKREKTIEEIIKEIEEIEKKYRRGIIGKRKSKILEEETKKKELRKVRGVREEIIKLLRERVKNMKEGETVIDILIEILKKYDYITLNELVRGLGIDKRHAESLANLLVDARIAKIKYTLLSTKIYLGE